MDTEQLGYRVVLPPGWVRIPLREDAGPTVDAILDRSFSELPRDKYGPIRAELRKKLFAQIEAARRNEGIDLYVPIERMHGQVIAASFIVGLMPSTAVDLPPPEDVLVAFAAESEGASLTEIDGAGAVRAEKVVAAAPDANPEDESSFGSRRVDYLIAMPQRPDVWLSVSFSTLGDGDPDGEVAALLVELFDAVMSTFRWTTDQPHGTPR